MKKIILFTNMSSIQKHWDHALVEEYNRLHMKDLKELFHYLELNTSPIILMLDELSVKDIESTLEELNSFSHAKILLFTSLPQVHHASRLLTKHISGYENSYLDKINLLHMLKLVESGKNWFFTDLTNYIINKYIQDNTKQEPSFIQNLTLKEKEIALMVAEGLTNKEIAHTQKLALSTVKGYLHKIFEKAGVTDRVSLAIKFK